MPIRSKAQRRWLHWAEGQKKLPEGTAARWEAHTPEGEPLPERVGEKAAALGPAWLRELVARVVARR